MLFKR